LLPPLPPFLTIGLRVFKPMNSSSGVNQWKNPLVHFNATSASFSLACRLSTQRMCRPHPSFERHLAEALWPFSVCGIRRPSFHSPCGKRPVSVCPAYEESRASGFGYPLAVLHSSYPSEASFSSQHSWASPFRAFFLLSDRSEGFPSPLRSCALLQNRYDLVPALQRLSPT